jgi:hypothetical protein
MREIQDAGIAFYSMRPEVVGVDHDGNALAVARNREAARFHSKRVA